jgi:hypothetical protein
MDDSARGIATAALTLQSDLLKALVDKALLTRAEALAIVDSSLLNAASHPDAEATLGAAEITRICLQGVRDGIIGTIART